MPGHGKVKVTDAPDEDEDERSFEGVAAVLVEVLDSENTFRKAFGVTTGKSDIKEVLDAL